MLVMLLPHSHTKTSIPCIGMRKKRGHSLFCSALEAVGLSRAGSQIQAVKKVYCKCQQNCINCEEGKLDIHMKLCIKLYRTHAGQNVVFTNMGLYQHRLGREMRNGMCPIVFKAVLYPDLVLWGCVFLLFMVIIQMHECHYH